MICKSIEWKSAVLSHWCVVGSGNRQQSFDGAKEIAADLEKLIKSIRAASVSQVVRELIDVESPLEVKN